MEPVASIRVNGTQFELPRDTRVSLLDALRETFHLYATKKGCDQGACGACTVLVDGERILACLALAVQYEGRAVTTIEGLTHQDQGARLQEAFIDQDGPQCKYCAPGQICSAVGMAGEIKRGLPSYVTADFTTEVISRDKSRSSGSR